MMDAAMMLLSGSDESATAATIDWSSVVTDAVSSVAGDITTVITAGVPAVIGIVGAVAVAKFVIKWVKSNISKAG